MKEIVGDYWDYWRSTNCTASLVCTTNTIVKSNGDLVMGAGIAKEFKEKFPWLPSEWGNKQRVLGEQTPYLMITYHGKDFDTKMGEYLIAFPTKIHWKDPSIPALIASSAHQLMVACKALDIRYVLMTRPGCGNGGLTWDVVKPILQEELDDRFVIISKE